MTTVEQKIPECVSIILTPWSVDDLTADRIRNLVRTGIRNACSDLVKDAAIDNIMGSIERGDITAWQATGYDEAVGDWFIGFVTTAVLDDKFMCCKDMRIGTVSAYGGLSDELWKQAFAVLERHAVANGCDMITADVIQPELNERMQKLGFLPVSCRMLKEV
jgi:hypothetical protein